MGRWTRDSCRKITNEHYGSSVGIGPSLCKVCVVEQVLATVFSNAAFAQVPMSLWFIRVPGPLVPVPVGLLCAGR